MVEKIKQVLSQIQEQIAPYTPNIVAVTKYFGREAILDAYQVGLRNFGESRAVEAIEKINSLPEEVKENSNFHLIGNLQGIRLTKLLRTSMLYIRLIL